MDLDCLGDPGAYFGEWVAEPAEAIMNASTEEEASLARLLANAYMAALVKRGYVLPSDCAQAGEDIDDEAIFTEDFLGFIREWRRRATEAECFSSTSGRDIAPPEGARLGSTSDPPQPVSTWSLLQQLGFQPDAEVISEPRPGLSFDFGNLKLNASAVTNEWLNPVVLFTGIFTTPRTSTLLEFELPRTVESREQGLALLAYYLDSQAGDPRFTPEALTLWLEEGRECRRLLPWQRSLEEYRCRPRCTVERDWLRLALNRLKLAIKGLPADALISFKFDGVCLVIRAPAATIRVQAEGEAWLDEVALPVGNLRWLPKRLTQCPVSIVARDDGISIGTRVIGVELRDEPSRDPAEAGPAQLGEARKPDA